MGLKIKKFKKNAILIAKRKGEQAVQEPVPHDAKEGIAFFGPSSK